MSGGSLRRPGASNIALVMSFCSGYGISKPGVSSLALTICFLCLVIVLQRFVLGKKTL